MKIYVTRHSLTLWNEEKRLQGWKDSPLTKQGINDAEKLGEYIKDYQIDQIYSSPIERAYQTSLHIFPNKYLPKQYQQNRPPDMLPSQGNSTPR